MIKKIPLLLWIVLVVGFLSYVNIYNNRFLWDDEFNIQKNEFIRSFSYLPQIFASPGGAGAGRIDNFYRPVKLVVYTAIHSVFGLRPFGFHLVNVLLHLGNASLIFYLMKKLFNNEKLAFLTALFWVVHPVHTEAVTYISATQDPLAVLFGLSSIWFYLKFRSKKHWQYLIWSLLLFVPGLLTKESIIIIPGLLFLVEFFTLGGRRGEFYRKITGLAPYVLVSVGYYALRLTILNFGGTTNLYQVSNIYTENLSYRLDTFLAALPTYYWLLVFPVGLHMERRFPVFTRFTEPTVLISLAILIVLAVIAVGSWRQKKPLFAFGISWFLISFIPTSGIIPINALLLEHWLYLPSIGFFLLLSAAILSLRKKFPKSKPVIDIGIGLAVTILMVMTLVRNRDWRDPITFYHNILKYHDATARVHNNLAMAYAEAGNLPEAEKQYLIAIDMSDVYPQTHYNLARLYLTEGDQENAETHLLRSLEIHPGFFYSYALLGELYEFQGKTDLSEEYLKKAREIQYY